MGALRAALSRGAPAAAPARYPQRARGLGTVRPVEKVRLKWVRNRCLDHVIERDTSTKAACLLKDLILRSPSRSLPSRLLPPLKKPLGLTVAPLRFLRRHPSLFLESPDPRFPSAHSFRLSPTSLLLHRLESRLHLSPRLLPSSASRLARLLMMCRSRSLPLKTLIPLRYDLALPDDFLSSVLPRFPDLFRVSRRADGVPALELLRWPAELAVSAVQRLDHRTTARSSTPSVVFPMSFPRGYGTMRKVKAWMEEFDRLPYFSPYEDVSGIDPTSEIMEKRVVGVLHELLSLMVHRKTKRNYLRGLREEMTLPHKFTRVFTRYPGVFYLSLKCKTTTVVLREGYRRGRLVDPHPLVRVRDRYCFVMRTGAMRRGNWEERVGSLLEEGSEVGDERLGEVLEEGGEVGDEWEGESEGEEYCEGTASEEDDSGSEEE